MSKVYLAHNYAAIEVLTGDIKILEAYGHYVTSRWITAEPSEKGVDDAVMDLEDVSKADALILYTDNHGTRVGRGKYVEMGFALRDGKKIILVGSEESQRSCIFYYLPNIRHCSTLAEAMKFL